MEEIARFLAAVAPFADLTGPALASAARRSEIEYFPSGSRVPVLPDGPGGRVLVVRAGTIELRLPAAQGGRLAGRIGAGQRLNPAVSCGEAIVTPEAVALEDTLALLVPADAVALPGGSPLVATRGLGPQPPCERRLADLASARFVTCAADATVAAAAWRMREADAAVLVVLSDPPGVVTDRDLRNQVLAGGFPAHGPVAGLALAPPLLLPCDTPAVEALVRMLAADAALLLATRDGLAVAAFALPDLARAFSPVPLGLAASAQELRTCTADLGGAGAPLAVAGAYRAAGLDRVVRQAIRAHVRDHGPAPCRYAWLALGSWGRGEATGPDGEASALVSEGSGTRHAAWFSGLAKDVTDALGRVGHGQGGAQVVASNPLWCRPLDTWQHYFFDWAEAGESATVSRAAAFLDARTVEGDAGLAEVLGSLVRRTWRSAPSFRRQLAAAVLGDAPPIGLYRAEVLEADGRTTPHLDLQPRILECIADHARVAALEADVTTLDTTQRLLRAADRSHLDTPTAQALAQAFQWTTRLVLQSREDRVTPGALAARDRAGLEAVLGSLTCARERLRSTGEGA